jgi:hypothetical protein
MSSRHTATPEIAVLRLAAGMRGNFRKIGDEIAHRLMPSGFVGRAQD